MIPAVETALFAEAIPLGNTYLTLDGIVGSILIENKRQWKGEMRMLIGPVELTNFMTSRNFVNAVFVYCNVRNTSGRDIKELGIVLTPLNKFGDVVGSTEGFSILDLPASSSSFFKKTRAIKSPSPLWNDRNQMINGLRIDGIGVRYMNNEEKTFATGGGSQFIILKTDINWFSAPLR